MQQRNCTQFIDERDRRIEQLLRKVKEQDLKVIYISSLVDRAHNRELMLRCSRPCNFKLITLTPSKGRLLLLCDWQMDTKAYPTTHLGKQCWR